MFNISCRQIVIIKTIILLWSYFFIWCTRFKRTFQIEMNDLFFFWDAVCSADQLSLRYYYGGYSEIMVEFSVKKLTNTNIDLRHQNGRQLSLYSCSWWNITLSTRHGGLIIDMRSTCIITVCSPPRFQSSPITVEMTAQIGRWLQAFVQSMRRKPLRFIYYPVYKDFKI